jgi:hypothetical protein
MPIKKSQGLPPVDRRKAGSSKDEALNAILRQVLNTREVRRLLIAAVSELMNAWAIRSRWKQKVSKAAEYVVARQLALPEGESEKDEIRLLFEDEKFIKHLVDQLPGLIHLLSGAMEAGSQTLEKLSTDEKKNLLAALFAKTTQGRTAALTTGFARMLNDIHKSDPEFLARTLEPGFRQWIESMDFGELKEALENSAQDAQALASMANNVIWEYPAKVVLLLSLLPTLANLTAGAVEISVGKLNSVPPDLLTDIVLAFLKELDGSAVARVVDELTEVVRKIHTGSALLGEPGAPQLPKVLSDVFEKIMAETDPATFWKAKIALAELKAAFDQQWSEAINNNSEYARVGLMNRPELFNIRARTRNQKLSFWDALDDEELSQSILQHLSGYDIQEAADMLNNMLRIANRLYAHKPDACADFIRQFANAVDYDELAEMVRQVFSEMHAELRPVARTIVPGLVQWVCETLQPQDDEFEDDAALARDALRALLIKEEV